MAVILSGTIVRDGLKATLKEAISKLPVPLTLVIFQVGHRPDSDAYIAQKKRLGAELGVRVIHYILEESISEAELKERIKMCNSDDSVHGIIVQIPLPPHLNKNKLINTIAPRKDVDGLTNHNIGAHFHEEKEHIPATARGIMSLIHYYKISIAGKRVVIVGRSNLVGKPTVLEFLKENATVTVAHKHTTNLQELMKHADILVVAIGNPKFITKDYVAPGQTIIDVGINRTSQGKLVGDVDFEAVEPIVAAITPVPGGVGPMTVISLFQNLLDAYN